MRARVLSGEKSLSSHNERTLLPVCITVEFWVLTLREPCYLFDFCQGDPPFGSVRHVKRISMTERNIALDLQPECLSCHLMWCSYFEKRKKNNYQVFHWGEILEFSTEFEKNAGTKIHRRKMSPGGKLRFLKGENVFWRQIAFTVQQHRAYMGSPFITFDEYSCFTLLS